jgi:hypothetical protein
MSFRVGNQGHEMWPACLQLGVAAITYGPLSETDLSKYREGEPEELWRQLEPTQKASLRRVVYEMKGGDAIYVKQGPRIVDKGIVKGPPNKRAYRFDSELRLTDPDGTPWAHQVPVDWSSNFPDVRVLLGGEQLTVKKLSAEEVDRIESAVAATRKTTPATRSNSKTANESLIEDAYYRESPARLKFIIPRHNKLSNEFVKWLKKRYGIDAIQEQQQVDIRFGFHGETHIAELKVCFGVDSRKSIREALGQLLEYNHYPKRRPADTWLIILDDEPSLTERNFIENLREKRSLPIVLGWRSAKEFEFHPYWPKGPH